ncbi:MAG: iron-only hydrogenase system regulator [Anaerostipes sp.]|nr:iron-only hydrogenase system regulator [Anaerostipes sp.]
METKIALIGIIIEEEEGIDPTNQLLHEYREYIVGRMGIPYKQRDISIISIVLDAPQTTISTISGKLGMIPGTSVKSVIAKTK